MSPRWRSITDDSSEPQGRPVPPKRMTRRRISFPSARRGGAADRLILERDRHDDAIVGTHVLRDVPLAGRILDQRDVPRPDRDLLASRHFELRASTERDDELTARPD